MNASLTDHAELHGRTKVPADQSSTISGLRNPLHPVRQGAQYMEQGRAAVPLADTGRIGEAWKNRRNRSRKIVARVPAPPHLSRTSRGRRIFLNAVMSPATRCSKRSGWPGYLQTCFNNNSCHCCKPFALLQALRWGRMPAQAAMLARHANLSARNFHAQLYWRFVM